MSKSVQLYNSSIRRHSKITDISKEVKAEVVKNRATINNIRMRICVTVIKKKVGEIKNEVFIHLGIKSIKVIKAVEIVRPYS